MNKIDARGLSCPKPVIETKKLLDSAPETEEIIVIVDNKAAVENVSRFLKSQGFEVQLSGTDDSKTITGKRSGNFTDYEKQQSDNKKSDDEDKKTVIFISSDSIGTGDDTLGRKLMINFLSTLDEYGESLWKIVFVNSGVKLTSKGSETIGSLKTLKKRGVDILVCGTCLEHYGLTDKKEAGSTTNMLDIITAMDLADKVISV